MAVGRIRMMPREVPLEVGRRIAAAVAITLFAFGLIFAAVAVAMWGRVNGN